jgi:phosphatidylglycerophosphate synthase
MGIVLPIISYIYMCFFDITGTAIFPASVFLLNGFSMFWYQTLDAIDGKQARKTNNCSALG